MSQLTLNSNISALRTQRRLRESSNALGRSFERLSSGLRINRASDDAAGLAIAQGLKVDGRVFAQGVRNLNDGISLLNIADGALSQLSSITIRLSELASQAANGTLSFRQRKQLDNEAQELAAEYERIVQSTEFNGRTLFSGEFGELSLQAGYGSENATIRSGLGGAVGTGDFNAGGSVTSTSDYGAQIVDINLDGNEDIISIDSANEINVALGNGDGTFGSEITSTLGSNSSQDFEVADFNNDGLLDIAASDASGGQIEISLGNGDGSFTNVASLSGTGTTVRSVGVGDFNNDGNIDVVSSGTSSRQLFYGDGAGGFSSGLNLGATAVGEVFDVADINGDGLDDILAHASGGTSTLTILTNHGNGSFSSSTISIGSATQQVTTGDFNNDGAADIIVAAPAGAFLALNNGDGTFQSATSVGATSGSIAVADLNSDGNLDFIQGSPSTSNIGVYLGNGEGDFSLESSLTLSGGTVRGVGLGDLNGDGVLDLAATSSTGGVSYYIGDAEDGVASLLAMDLTTRAGALQAMSRIENSLNNISLQRGEIGAFLSRVGTGVSNLQQSTENIAAAESQIRDVDVARESANLVRSGILQQAGASILSQANQLPALALSLIG